ncbi:hypothetical protein [Streptomyces sp. NPDC093568]|uniref:hypothetical protein n=1 Tax=Streptomyces sp. NPDC093568 TaxID=3366041 RepID=UPI0038113C42
MTQRYIKVISAVFDLDAWALVRASQISPWLLESPLVPTESHSNRVRPQVFGFNTSHSRPSSS